ncbi:MAG: hypothetical protein R3E13_06630 [Alphaproteobacteria bacterium]
MALSWVIFALIAALAQAVVPLVGEYFKTQSLPLLFWMRLAVVVALVPFAIFLVPPGDPLFFVFVFIAALGAAYWDIYYLGLAAEHGGAGVVTRIEPLAVAVTFVLWLVFAPALIAEYIQSPVRGICIVFALLGSVYFSMRLRHCPVSWPALRRFAPATVVGALTVICGKLAMDHSGYHNGVAWYVFMQSIFSLGAYGLLLGVRPLRSKLKDLGQETRLFSRSAFVAGLALAVPWLVHTPAKYYAISAVENPAYVTVIGLTAPFWVLLVYKTLGRRERADILSGLGVVFFAMLLVVFSQLL